jgi:hypothetical protein
MSMTITVNVIRAICVTMQANRDPEWAAQQPQDELKWAEMIIRSVANSHMAEKLSEVCDD